MKKIAVSAYIVFSLVFTSVIFLPAMPVVACPDREPETLLSLYVASEFVYRARYVGQESGEAKNDGEGTITTEIKRTFEPVATFKGKPADKVELYHNDYQYEPVEAELPVQPEAVIEEGVPTESSTEEKPVVHEEPVPAEEEPEYDEEEEEIELKPGDTVLLFLRNDEESSRIVLTDYVDGLKRLESQDRDVYEARIKELAPIMAKKKPDVEAIIDWLIRCAEEKATRWEGTYELERSFRNVEYEKAQEEEEKPSDEKTEEGGEEEPPFGLGGTSEYAKAITEYHRQTLTNLFIRTRGERKPSSKDNEEIRGDLELMQLVTKWPDQRIAPALIAQLREGGTNHWEMSQAMDALATILRDKRLEDLSTKFEELMYANDEEIAEVAGDEIDKSKAKLKTNRKPLTNGELRVRVLAKFIDRATRASEPEKAEGDETRGLGESHRTNTEKQKMTAVKTTKVRIEQ